MYKKRVNGIEILLALYVDDGLVLAEDVETLESFLKLLQKIFEAKVCKSDYFIGLQINHIKSKGFHSSKELHRTTNKEVQLRKYKTNQCSNRSSHKAIRVKGG